MQTRRVFFKPGFTGLAGFKPGFDVCGFDNIGVSVRRAWPVGYCYHLSVQTRSQSWTMNSYVQAVIQNLQVDHGSVAKMHRRFERKHTLLQKLQLISGQRQLKQHQGFCPFVKIKFKDFSRTFKDHIKD